VPQACVRAEASVLIIPMSHLKKPEPFLLHPFGVQQVVCLQKKHSLLQDIGMYMYPARLHMLCWPLTDPLANSLRRPRKHPGCIGAPVAVKRTCLATFTAPCHMGLSHTPLPCLTCGCACADSSGVRCGHPGAR